MTNPIFVMISRFMKEFPEHVVSMSDIDHNYSAIMPNPYHIEGSIWTHTMMVLNEAVRRGYDDTIQATALCHDIGKAYSRGEREKDGKMRVSFNGHEGIAFYHTIDVLDRLFPEKPATWKIQVERLVAMHSMLYRFSPGKNGKSLDEWVHRAFNGNASLLNDLGKFCICDASGRFSAEPEDLSIYEHYSELDLPFSDRDIKGKPQLWLMVGAPGSGKSTFKREHLAGAVHIERDEIVEELGGKETYSESWHTVDQTAVSDLEMQRFQKAISAKENVVVVDETFMSVKSRRRFLTIANRAGYTSNAVMFHTGHKAIMEVRKGRHAEGKIIPAEAIHRMMSGFSYPTLAEFDTVHAIRMSS